MYNSSNLYWIFLALLYILIVLNLFGTVFKVYEYLTKKSIMKSVSIVFMAAIVFASCKGKDSSLQTDKNIVILTDTAKANGSYLSDTGIAKMPVAAAPVAAAPAPTRRTNTTKQRTSTTYGTSNNNNNSTASNTSSSTNTGTTTTTTTKKKGWSKTAKGAVIGGVGGAVAGAVIGKGKGAVIGGVLGAAGGAIIGRSKDKKDGRVQ